MLVAIAAICLYIARLAEQNSDVFMLIVVRPILGGIILGVTIYLVLKGLATLAHLLLKAFGTLTRRK